MLPWANTKWYLMQHCKMLTPSLADLHVGSLDVSHQMADGIPARILRSSHSIAPAGVWTTFEKWGEGTASRIDFVACNESQTLSMITNFGCSFALTACTHINISLKSRGLQLPQPPPLAYTFALPLLNCSTCQLQWTVISVSACLTRKKDPTMPVINQRSTPRGSVFLQVPWNTINICCFAHITTVF